MLKRLTVWLLMLTLCLAFVAGMAEDDDIDLDAWASTQEAADAQLEWAALQGMDIDTSVTAQNITKKCKIKVSEGSKSRLTDGKVGSPWKYEHADATIKIAIPEGVTPGAIRVEWMFDPTGYELTEYDASQTPLRIRTQDDTFPGIYTMYALNPQTRSIQLRMTAKDQGIGNLAIYSAGVLPGDVQTWLPPVEKADMMVFSTHQDDEVIFMGGTIPYSDVVCNRPTITVYMANCSRDRRREALECLWEMGSRHYPEFINLKDEKVSSVERGVKLWGGKDNILKEIVARIRRYKPEVIVTHDLEGEYGHNQHKVVARAMQPAIEAAADPNQFPESYNQYGAWQVKKLYLHLYKENQIRMDWNAPQDAFGGETLLEVARRGMKKHASQTKYYKVKDGGEYDNALYGLALTTVGEDVKKNDFFENIPLNGTTETVDEAPTAPSDDDGWEDAADEPDDGWAEADAFDDEPTEFDFSDEDEAAEEQFVPSATMMPVKEKAAEQGSGNFGIFVAAAGAGAALAGAGLWWVSRQQGAKKKRHSGKKKSKASAVEKSAKSGGKHAAKHKKS